MRIDYSKRFLKQVFKSDQNIQKSLQKRLTIFIEDKFSPELNNHKISGELEDGIIIFFDFWGTYSGLYK